MAPLLGQEYHLFTDNWYTAVTLVEAFLLEGTNLTGTVHSKRKYLPAVVKKKLTEGETVEKQKEQEKKTQKTGKTDCFVWAG